MVQVDVHEAKEHLSLLLQKVELGEVVIIESDGVPVAKLVSLTQSRTPVAGSLKGRIRMSADFDAPLPESNWLGEE